MALQRSFCICALFTLVTVFAFSANLTDLKPATDAVAASVYTGPSMTTLSELTDTVGGRLTGSPAV